MSRRNESIPHILVYDAPWWVSAILAGVVYSLMRWVAPPLYLHDTLMMGNIMRAMPKVAWIFALPFLGFTGLNLLVRVLRRK
jgi:hypothetical protein